MLILLPPSEGKAAPRRGKPLDLASLGSPALTPARERVLEALIELCDVQRDPSVPTQNAVLLSHAAATLGLGPSQSDLVHQNAGLRTAATARADRIYTGVLYDALDFATLSPAAKRRATARVGIASSLFGMVRPSDAIPAYRLSGDVALPGLGAVAGVWRDALDPVMRETLGNGLLVDLRSGMYAAFWRPPADLAPQVATVRVLHEHNGTRKVVSHFNKATKGRIVRAVLEHGGTPRTPDGFADLLVELGWDVEVHEPTKKGTQLDVVVSEL
ncbi:peroxide stress protein YaaA [Nocardioides sp.]|uniref:peroxide stress protein YaaA n=1 Tax=Nocardioides sp. TaxID=35761 RepID=UPI002CFB2E92|nr:peroxide stress protein YaaA [Nocardioides sp.]HSX68702.1 peroxide stress protein YaaA [Nocardioides sp.]